MNQAGGGGSLGSHCQQIKHKLISAVPEFSFKWKTSEKRPGIELYSEVLSEQKCKYRLCDSKKSAELPGAPLSASDTCQVPPCSSLASAFGCYQRNLALYQDLFYIICYHYIASNQIPYYCCFHLARYGTPTPSLWRHSSLLGSTFLMLSLNFPLLLTQSPSPHRCFETAMLPPPRSSFG